MDLLLPIIVGCCIHIWFQSRIFYCYIHRSTPCTHWIQRHHPVLPMHHTSHGGLKIWNIVGNSGAGLGCHPISNYVAVLDDPVKQTLINKQSLRSKMIGLYIKESFNKYEKCKLISLSSAYTLNTQYDGSTMFFVIVKMVLPDTRVGAHTSSLICKTCRFLSLNMIS